MQPGINVIKNIEKNTSNIPETEVFEAIVYFKTQYLNYRGRDN